MERIAVLLYHQNGLPFGQRNNADTTAVVYHVPLYNFSVLQFRSVFGDMENFCLINQITAFCDFIQMHLSSSFLLDTMDIISLPFLPWNNPRSKLILFLDLDAVCYRCRQL